MLNFCRVFYFKKSIHRKWRNGVAECLVLLSLTVIAPHSTTPSTLPTTIAICVFGLLSINKHCLSSALLLWTRQTGYPVKVSLLRRVTAQKLHIDSTVRLPFHIDTRASGAAAQPCLPIRTSAGLPSMPAALAP